MNLNFSFTIKALDNATAPIRRINQMLDRMRGGVERVSRISRAGAAASDRLNASTGRASRAFLSEASAASNSERALARLHGVIDRIRSATGRAAGPLRRFTGLLARIKPPGGLLKGFAATATKLSALAGAATGGLAGFGLFNFGKSVIAKGAEIEGYRELLATLTGSEAEAAKSMDWVKRFASRTPFQVAEVMNAFVKLKTYGIDPMNGSLQGIGEAAAVFKPLGKNLDDVVEAMADARMGEFERLKEFGIKATQQGHKVNLMFARGQKQMVVTTENNARDIDRAVIGIFNGNYQGAMQRQARTWAGMISMLQDRWSNFLETVANAGFFNFAKTELGNLLGRIQKWANDGTLQRWAIKLSDALTSAFKGMKNFAESVDWIGVAQGVAGVANAVAALARALGALNRLGNKLTLGPVLNGLSLGVPVGSTIDLVNERAARLQRFNRMLAPVPAGKYLPKLPATPQFAPKAPAMARPVPNLKRSSYTQEQERGSGRQLSRPVITVRAEKGTEIIRVEDRHADWGIDVMRGTVGSTI